jgi:hypothetical protein
MKKIIIILAVLAMFVVLEISYTKICTSAGQTIAGYERCLIGEVSRDVRL